MLLIALLIGNNTKGFLVAFIVHFACQYLVLFVRGYTEALPILNIGSEICLFIECVIIIFCFYIINNIKERKNE